jgi:hypothetical protein
MLTPIFILANIETGGANEAYKATDRRDFKTYSKKAEGNGYGDRQCPGR